MPDYFVPLDTMKYAKCYREMSAKSLIINASLRYTDKNRKRLATAYPTFERFKADFEVPDKVLEDLFKEAKKQKIEPKDEAEKKLTEANICRMVKALVARDLWDMSEYFAIIYADDDVVKKAVELLTKGE